MNDLAAPAKEALEQCKNADDIRKLWAKLLRNVKDESIGGILGVYGKLLEQHNWAMGVIAFGFAYRLKKHKMTLHLPYGRLVRKVCTGLG